jgi:polysaccharide biosynthesis/export protein
MKRHSLLLYLAIVLLGSSCVTNKQYTFLQKDDVNKRNLPKDTIVRKYDIQDYEYRIQSEDNVSVQFQSLTPQEFDIFNRTSAGGGIQNQNLNQGNAIIMGELVDPEGNITYPVIGKVNVAGLTVYEAQNKLQKIADEYLDSPVVKVRIINFRFTILGEARSEGSKILANNRVSLMEAIGVAGGLTDLADKRNVKIIRQNGAKAEVRYVDLLNEDLLQSPDYYIRQNDILIIPALRQRPYQVYFGKNLALLISSVSLLLLTLSLINQN